MAELHKAYTEKEDDTFYRICQFMSASKLFKIESRLILDVGCNAAVHIHAQIDCESEKLKPKI